MHALNRSRFYELDRVATLDVPGRCVKLQTELEMPGPSAWGIRKDPHGEEPGGHSTPQQKVAILREHLVEQVPVSDLCDKHKLHPTLFYQWQKAFFENGAAAFEGRRPRSHSFSKEEDHIPTWRPSSETRPRCFPRMLRNWCAQKSCWGRAQRPLGCPCHPQYGHRLYQAAICLHRDQLAAPGGLD